MKLLPHFKEETPTGFSGAISLRENVGHFNIEDAERISRYMESCTVIESWLSNIEDIISKKFSIPAKTWSDGAFAWESSHIHYLKNYRARLPDEFVSHVGKQIESGPQKEKTNKDDLLKDYQKTVREIISGNQSHYAVYKN